MERRNRHAAAKLKRDTEEHIGWSILRQIPQVRFTKPVWLLYLWVEPNRKRDKGNIAAAQKFVEDALVSAKVIRNDGWSYIAGFSHDFAVDKENPMVKITITDEITEDVI